jgi:hypothetical protein
MKFCERHWTALKAAIDERGLDVYVARGGQTAAAKVTDAAQRGEFTLDNFDPLLGAHNRIVMHAINAVGLAVLADNADGTERCPLCYLTERHAAICKTPNCDQEFESWITLAADGAKETLEHLLQKQPRETKS